jgi:hypothetical protein
MAFEEDGWGASFGEGVLEYIASCTNDEINWLCIECLVGSTQKHPSCLIPKRRRCNVCICSDIWYVIHAPKFIVRLRYTLYRSFVRVTVLGSMYALHCVPDLK